MQFFVRIFSSWLHKTGRRSAGHGITFSSVRHRSIEVFDAAGGITAVDLRGVGAVAADGGVAAEAVADFEEVAAVTAVERLGTALGAEQDVVPRAALEADAAGDCRGA